MQAQVKPLDSSEQDKKKGFLKRLFGAKDSKKHDIPAPPPLDLPPAPEQKDLPEPPSLPHIDEAKVKDKLPEPSSLPKLPAEEPKESKKPLDKLEEPLQKPPIPELKKEDLPLPKDLELPKEPKQVEEKKKIVKKPEVIQKTKIKEPLELEEEKGSEYDILEDITESEPVEEPTPIKEKIVIKKVESKLPTTKTVKKTTKQGVKKPTTQKPTVTIPTVKKPVVAPKPAKPLSPEQYFKLKDGKALKDIDELLKAVQSMPADVFIHHVNEEKNDFANWIKNVIKDENLALKIASLKTKRDVGEALKSFKKEKLLADELHQANIKLKEDLKTSKVEQKIRIVEMQKAQKEFVRQEEMLKKQLEKLDTKKVEVTQKEKELLSTISEEKTLQSNLSQKEQDIATAKQELSDAKNQIEIDLKTIVPQSQDALKQFEALKADINSLMTEFNNKSDGIKTDYQTLQKNEQMLKNQQLAVDEKLKQINAGKKTILQKYEQSKKLFVDGDTKAVANKLLDTQLKTSQKELSFRERTITSQEKRIKTTLDRLELQKDKIKKAREFNQNIDVLEKKKDLLTKVVGDLELKEKSLSDRLEDLEKREAIIEVKEPQLLNIEKELAAKEQLLLEKERQLTTEQESITDDNFHLYLSQEIDKLNKGARGVAGATFSGVAKQAYDMISQARGFLNTGGVADARSVYSQLEKLYPQVPEDNNKKKLYYDIIDLKTDIELASLD
ncbi:hypothetical protein GOV04_03480 [Candidatus Woesearchaeota archaeon]|nr:hypothetical protein [Candidatus Woesearchaeota archaeon]